MSKNLLRYAGTCQQSLQIGGRRIQLFELAFNDEFTSVIFVFRDIVAIETVIGRFTVGCDLALGNVHDLTAVVLAFMSEDDDGKRLSCLRKRNLHAELESSLTKERDSAVCGFSRTGVYRGYDCVSRQRGFHGRVCFGVSNLTDHDNVGVETESGNNEVFLCDVVRFVFGRTGQRVYHVIDGFTEAIFLDEKQLSRTGFDGIDTFIVGNARKTYSA